MFWGCADIDLTASSLGGGVRVGGWKPRFVVFADICGVNTPTVVDYRLPTYVNQLAEFLKS